MEPSRPAAPADLEKVARAFATTFIDRMSESGQYDLGDRSIEAEVDRLRPCWLAAAEAVIDGPSNLYDIDVNRRMLEDRIRDAAALAHAQRARIQASDELLQALRNRVADLENQVAAQSRPVH
jgi:hypothetical protein